MPQISKGLNGKTKTALSYFFGIASLFLAAKANAQESGTEQGIHKITAVDSFNQNNAKKAAEITFLLNSLEKDSTHIENNSEEKIPVNEKTGKETLDANLYSLKNLSKDNLVQDSIPDDVSMVKKDTLSNRDKIPLVFSFQDSIPGAKPISPVDLLKPVPTINFPSASSDSTRRVVPTASIVRDSIPGCTVSVKKDAVFNVNKARQLYLDSLQSYLKKDPRIENVEAFINTFSFRDSVKIRMDTVQVKNPYDFVTQAAYFSPNTDEIVMFYHQLGLTLGEFNVSHDHRMKGFTYQDLQREIKIANDNIPFVFFHEFVAHRLNRRSYTPFGFTNSQDEQINIADEVSGPFFEMVVCREIYRATGDLDAAFHAQEQRGKSKIIQDNYFRSASVYADFLKKNPNIGAIPLQNEIDAMIRAATGTMNKNSKRYKSAIPRVVEDDFSRAKFVSKFKAAPERYKGQSILFDETIKNYFTAYGVSFLEACSQEVRNEFMSFILSVKNAKPFRKNMEKVYAIYVPMFEQMKADLVKELGLSQESMLDTDAYERSIFMAKQKNREK
ncbi:MAG: hypothetical protein LBF37_03595 [Rickettsiales bacterium]|jgi:hypothetical protein|nr:hypothetical protein [Rickettsiales bacterium]